MIKEIKGDYCRILELIRKLNARQEFSRLAQMLLSEVLSRVDAESLHEAAKAAGKQKLLEDIIEACEIYGLKHYARADKNLKQSYYVQYVISQMTLQADIQAA